jgi:type IV pilus assembly protein PilQ
MKCISERVKLRLSSASLLILGVVSLQAQKSFSVTSDLNSSKLGIEDKNSDLDSLQELEDSVKKKEGQSSNQSVSPISSQVSQNNQPKRKIQAEGFEDEEKNIEPAPASKVKKTEAVLKTSDPIKSTEDFQKNELFNMEFKVEGGISRIFISAKHKLKYRESKNLSAKQYVYLLENVTVPERLERAYDTSEFVSPIALFTLLQLGQPQTPFAKLIIQLREDKVPNVTNTEKGMFIDFPPPNDEGETKFSIGQGDKNLIPEESSYSSNQTFSGKPIDRLEIKNTDVQDVIRLIGRSSGYNMVIGDDVTGKIGALSLENIPWDQALALVLQSKKLGYVRQGNVLRVASLTSLKSEREEVAAAEASKVKAEPLKTVIIPISYAKATELAPKGKALLSERGNTEVDERSNSIIVRDVDRVIGKLQKLYAMLDTQPPIVSVSAKVVEMKADFTRNFGFNLSNLTGNTSGINASASFIHGGLGTNTINLTSSQFANLNATIGLSELENQTKVLANPSVSVNQNQKAVMTQTIGTFVQNVTFAVGGTSTVSYQEVDSVLSLEVTPIVAGDGSISMTVNVKNEIPQLSANGQLASIDKRNVQTQVLLENGDTAVIGGAFSSSQGTNLDGVPGLMRLPLVGMLFQGKTVHEVKNEILIFLTAKILNTEESFKRTF